MEVSNLHQIKAPLNKLLSKDMKWTRSVDCQQSFKKIKASHNSDLRLTCFDPTQKVSVVADASSHVVGAVTSHIFADRSEKAIMHAARSLTPANSNYSQVEKEAFALIFAVNKFHKMLFGRCFTLLKDHKLLLSIFGSKKGIPVYSVLQDEILPWFEKAKRKKRRKEKKTEVNTSSSQLKMKS